VRTESNDSLVEAGVSRQTSCGARYVPGAGVQSLIRNELQRGVVLDEVLTHGHHESVLAALKIFDHRDTRTATDHDLRARKGGASGGLIQNDNGIGDVDAGLDANNRRTGREGHVQQGKGVTFVALEKTFAIKRRLRAEELNAHAFGCLPGAHPKSVDDPYHEARSFAQLRRERRIGSASRRTSHSKRSRSRSPRGAYRHTSSLGDGSPRDSKQRPGQASLGRVGPVGNERGGCLSEGCHME